MTSLFAAVSSFQAVVLGIVQGLTEFLPISSTAHIRIVPAFAGWADPGAAFTAVIQLGTTAAVVIFFREDLLRLGHAVLRSLRSRSVADQDAKLGWMVLLGTIPIGIFGLAFKDQIETGGRNLTLIGCTLIALGLVLGYAEHVATRRREMEEMTWRDGAIIGGAQALALVPGVSRSGSTISAGLFLGLDRVAAARFSFLLAIPAVVLSGLFELKGLLDGSTEGAQPAAGAVVIATLVSFVVGYASIALLLRFLTRHSTWVFVGYRVALGALVLALVAANAIS